MKRWFVVMLVIGLLLVTVGALSAQQAEEAPYPVETIPVESLGISVKLSPDDHTLAVYNQYAIYDEAPAPALIVVRLIDTRTGDEIGSLSGYTDWVTGLDFTSDGSQLATFHRNGDLNLWDVASLSLIKTIPLYLYGGSWVEFLPDDQTILYRASNFLIGTLDTATGAITHLFGKYLDTYDEFASEYIQFPGQADLLIAAAAVSPNGRWLAMSNANDQVFLVEISSGKRWLLRDRSEQAARFSIRQLVFSNDSQQLIYFDQSDEHLHVWDVVNQTELHDYDFGAVAFALAPDDATLAWVDRDAHAVYLLNPAESSEPTEVLTLPEDARVAPTLTSVAFTSDGSQLVVGGLLPVDGATQIYVVDLAPAR